MMSNFSKIEHDRRSCEACMLNTRRKAVPKVTAKPTVYTYSYFGQRVSSDTAGPFPESSSGFKYAVCFYDHFTKYVAIYFLRTHYGNEVLMALKSFVLDHKRYLDKTKVPGVIDWWHTDNGTEFVTTNIDEYCREVSTRHSMSPPYTRLRATPALSVYGASCSDLLPK